MKRIEEAVVRSSDLRRFCQCAEKLGVFGFDLCEYRDSRAGRSRDGDRLQPEGNLTSERSRLKVDFAVLDIDTKDAIHAVLEQVHPDSIAIFKLDQEPSQTGRSGFGIDAQGVG